MTNIIEVKHLTKAYKDLTAVDDMTLQLEENKIYGLLGRNGAGKTTIMQLLTAQIFPSQGEIKVFGENPYENRRVLNQICFVKESQTYPDIFRVVDVLDTAASFFPRWDQSYAEKLVEQFQLPWKRRMKKLSRGMFSAVGIVVGLASRAPLTIFDEPYLGLDAVARNLFYNQLIEDYSNHPRTIILSTHLIDEVSQLLEQVIMIDQGKILLSDHIDHVRQRSFTLTGTKEKVEKAIIGKKVLTKKSLGSLLSVSVMESLSQKEQNRLQAEQIEVQPLSLQQLLVHLTERTRGESK